MIGLFKNSILHNLRQHLVYMMHTTFVSRGCDVREIFGILNRETSLYHRAMSKTVALFLGADVSDN